MSATVETNILNALEQFHYSDQFISSWNKIVIALVPKIENPLSPRDYRPISLCNLNYKILDCVQFRDR